jgi:hypothetical protein
MSNSVATDKGSEPQAASTVGLRYLLDSYLDWCKAEAIPIVESVATDLAAVETAPWPRLGPGVRGAFVHLAGRGDFVALQVIEIEPGGRTAWQKHLYDEIIYVLAGHGSTMVEIEKGRPIDFDWSTRALFSPPLNCPFRLSNASGHESVRLVVASDLPYLLNVFRNERFLFDNPGRFPERVGRDAYYDGKGDALTPEPGSSAWETTFVPDLATFASPAAANSRDTTLILADNALHAQLTDMPVGTYEPALSGIPGTHLLAIAGSGYTLTWSAGQTELQRQDWHPGWVFAPQDEIFHQHFNIGPAPARRLAVSLGSRRYPVLARKLAGNANPRFADGNGAPLAYQQQDPRIHRLFLDEMQKAGLRSEMDRYFGAAS